MRILVTGGLGFIGSNFIRYLLGKNQGIHIVNLDKMSIGANRANLKDIENKENYAFIKGDICDRNNIKKLFDKIDLIVNFAAESHVDRSIADPTSFYKSNVEGILTLLELVRNSNKKIRFLQVGTDESYGEISIGSFNEVSILKPSSPYAASKAAADMFCVAYYRTYGLDVMISRCSNNFGPFQFPEKFIPKVIIRAHLNKKIPVYGTGKNVRDWIYVADHCDAINVILEKGKSGEIYNISSGSEFENIEIVNKILNLMDKPKSLIEFVKDRPGHDIRYSLDSSKIRNELNWKPKYGFKEAIEKTVDWYLNNKSWWKDLVNDRIIHPTPWLIK